MPAELPEGFTLDQEQQPGQQQLPEGFVLDQPGADQQPIQSEALPEEPGVLESVGRGSLQTVKDISGVYPALETGLNLITSAYGIPAAGLGGLATLFATGDLDKADKALKAMQELLVYSPKTEAGQRLTETVASPFTEFEKVGEFAGGEIAELGYPKVAATVHSAISAAPALVGAKSAFGKTPGKSVSAVGKEVTTAIKKGINKAIRPSVAKKTTSKQVKGYLNKAESAVTEIVKNKDNLKMIDDVGNPVEGLPKTLDQFSQAIEQTKKLSLIHISEPTRPY